MPKETKKEYSLDVRKLKELGEQRADFSEDETFVLRIVNKLLGDEYKETGQTPWLDMPTMTTVMSKKLDEVFDALIERGVVVVAESAKGGD